MEKKLDLPKFWRQFTLGFMALCFLIVVIVMKKSIFWLIPIFIVYFSVNSILFSSYYLGMIGNFYFTTRNTEKAYFYYEKAIKKNTRNILALYNWALRLLQQGKAKEALEHFQRALKLNTGIMMDKNIRLAISSCYWVIGDVDKGIDTLERLIKDYEYINAHVFTTIGYLYFLKGDYDNALMYTQKAVDDTPEHAAAWDNFGQIYFKKGDIENAEKNFLKAIGYKDTMVDSYYYLGVISEERKDFKQAEQYYEKAESCPISSLNTVDINKIRERLEFVRSKL